MKAIFNIKGSIEIDLPEEIIDKFNEQRLEAGKKHVLKEYFHIMGMFFSRQARAWILYRFW